MLNSSAIDSCELKATHESLHVELSTFWYCFLAFITALGLLVALVSNMIIIYLFTKTPYLRRNPTNIIAVNLSLSDLLYCAQWPSVIYCSLTQSTWILEIEFVCQTFGFLTVSTALASIYTVLAMSIERAIVISCSIHAKGRFSIRGAWSIVVLIWIVSICSCLPPLFGKFNRYTLDPSKTSCTLDYLSDNANYKLYILFLYIAFWIAPAVLITICYALIIITFKRSSQSLRMASGCGVANDRVTSQQLQQATISSPTSISTVNSDANDQQVNNAFDFSLANRGRLFRLRDSIKSVRFVSTSHNTTQQLARRLTTPTIMQRGGHLLLARVPSIGRFTRGAQLKFNQQQSKDATHASPLPLPLPLPSPLPGHQSQSSRPQLRLASTTSTSSSNATAAAAAAATAANRCHIGTSSGQHSRTGIQIRLAKMSFYLILLWFVSWTPIASLALINSVLQCHRRPSALAVFLANTMTKLGPTFDVFIYGISHPKIKSKFKQIIRWLLIINYRSSPSAANQTGDVELPVQSMFRSSIRSQASRT